MRARGAMAASSVILHDFSKTHPRSASPAETHGRPCRPSAVFQSPPVRYPSPPPIPPEKKGTKGKGQRKKYILFGPPGLLLLHLLRSGLKHLFGLRLVLLPHRWGIRGCVFGRQAGLVPRSPRGGRGDLHPRPSFRRPHSAGSAHRCPSVPTCVGEDF